MADKSINQQAQDLTMQGAPLMSMGQGVADQLLPLLQLIAQYLPTSMGGGAPTMGSTTSQQVGPMPQSIMRADNPAVQAVNPRSLKDQMVVPGQTGGPSGNRFHMEY